MSYRRIDILLIGMIVVVSIHAIWLHVKQPRLAYVDTEYLLTNYEGTLAATKKLETKNNQWQGKIDSLKSLYMAKRENFITDSIMLNEEDRTNSREQLLRLKYNIAQFQSPQKEGFHKEDEKLSAGILNKVDYELAEYCTEHNYTLVLGATPGTVLYAEELINITEEVLEALNEKYSGE